ncbi:hypothetical protein Raf01_46600 [Rugosimonospora africana]|uniref:Aminoglycoside phosphotransferase domain-containing protein n=2 Tax=Rugosimonospora africana TaxID=556532 RepID=A0A8J3QTE9_9ACTN|nr:hypothetical protein Raf01_46600 [Rugosimonospora africana]
MRQETVAPWSGIELVRPLAGGARNEVVLAERGGQRFVVRRSTRAHPALEWELDLLSYLSNHGIGVPTLVPTDDGRRHVGGVLVNEFVDGHPPAGEGDWRDIVRVLTAVHDLTRGWPQRPGFASARELSVSGRGGDVRLDAMPPEAVRAVRAAWQPILTGTECVNHGDVGAGNALINDGGAVLLDWDEARVDVPWFDFALLPEDVPTGAPVDRETLVTAGVAWEAATCWVAEPEYGARRLEELRQRSG